MSKNSIQFYQRPEFNEPALIVGFGGWSNAGNCALKSIEHLIQKCNSKLLAEIDPDSFYQFTQNRPIISIKEGMLKNVSQTKVNFYYWLNKEGGKDIILLEAQEPDFRWRAFADIIFKASRQWGVSQMISIGGMYDDVLHTEAIVSGVYTTEEWRDVFIKKEISMINYEGPSGIHSIIMKRAKEEKMPFFGLWGHSPLYLRGTNFRVVIRTIELIASMLGFSVVTEELEVALKEFENQIEDILQENSELKEHIEKIKKVRRGEKRKKGTPKVVNIKDFIRPQE